MIPRERNDALILFGRIWKLDGDWMVCRSCNQALIASRDGELLRHGDSCRTSDRQHPWSELRALVTPVVTAKPLSEWFDDDHSVVWWRFPVEEPPYVGSPLSDDWPGYHTHWTPIEVPAEPE